MENGGKRVKAGRKPHQPRIKMRGFRLSDDQVKLLRMWGRGDASAGLRWLIDQAEKLVVKIEPRPTS